VSPKKPRVLKAHVTFLEMRQPPVRLPPMPTRPRLALLRAPAIPLPFYRYLYEQVGKPHHWMLRRAMADTQLAQAIHAPTTEIGVLYADGAPAGFFELDFSGLPARAELAYFGLCRTHVGLKLGRWFLAEAVAALWAKKPGIAAVHTNTLDHPAALPLYQRLGFEPVGVGEEEVEAWE
jgi:GNAT superfamily N-acetyltransferase